MHQIGHRFVATFLFVAIAMLGLVVSAPADRNFGALAQHWWSYAGDSDRPATNQTDIQYFINWKMDATQLVGMTPNIRINWEADSDDMLSLPIGLGTIGMFRIGKLPVRWGVEAQYYVVQPDAAGPEWNIKLFIAPIILNPLK